MSTASIFNAYGFSFKEERWEPCMVTVRNGDSVTVKEGLRSTLASNGIIEDATYEGWKTSTTHEARIAFLTNLTEEELDKEIMFSIDGKTVVGTYRQHREIYLTEQALFQRAKQLSDSAVDINNEKDPVVIEFNKVINLMSAVNRNMEGALSIAKSYLQSLNDPKDSIKLSPEALLRMGGNHR